MHGNFERGRPAAARPGFVLSALAGAVVSGWLLCAPPAQAQGQDAAAAVVAPGKIAALTVGGNTAFSQSALERAMGISATNWLSWYRHDDSYSSARLASALASLRSFYISRGYLRFAVKEVKTTPSADGKTVSIAITVAEGQRYTLASVGLGGDPDGLVTAPGVSEALLRALPIGEPVTRQGLDTAQRAMLAQLNHDGYPRASVTPRLTINDANGTIALSMDVTRGLQSAQASPVRESAVPPAATLPVAPPSSPSAAQAGQTEQAGQAAQTAQATVPEASASAASAASAAADITDQQRGLDLRAGVGYSTADRMFMSASARYPNAFGKGWDAEADLGFGRTFRELGVSEADHQFTSGGMGRSTRVWYRSDQPFYYLNGSSFRTSGTGVTERFDIPVDAADSAYIAPGFEHDWLGSLDANTPQAYQSYVQRVGSALNATTLRGGWSHDMRDSAAMPTRGYILQGDAELGLPGLGARYLKMDAGGRYYHPLIGDSVLSFSLRGGYGVGWGSKGYPLEKYYYLGGPDTVRGYATNSLGPRDTLTGYPIGGRRMLVGSVEAIEPLSRRFIDQGRLVGLVFVDGGNVWDGLPGGQSEGRARFSYGTGLGWQMPFGVLKVNFALPVKRYQGDDYQRFQLQFNAGF